MDYEMQPYWVYIKTDEKQRIIAINSDAFLTNTDGWVKIDEGFGDRYHHAQGHYLNKPIMDERGIYRYKLVDGEVMERTQEEMDADYDPPEEPADLQTEIDKLKVENARLNELILSMI